jgi:hypothetical protein
VKRTLWLALGFLTIVCALTALKAGVATPAKQQAAFSSGDVIEVDASQEPLPKADRLDVNYLEDMPDKKAVQTTKVIVFGADLKAAPSPLEKPAKILSRHWHEGDAKITKGSAPDRRAASAVKK